jgi:hypothetical protein
LKWPKGVSFAGFYTSAEYFRLSARFIIECLILVTEIISIGFESWLILVTLSLTEYSSEFAEVVPIICFVIFIMKLPKNYCQRIRLAAVLVFYYCQPTTEAD